MSRCHRRKEEDAIHLAVSKAPLSDKALWNH